MIFYFVFYWQILKFDLMYFLDDIFTSDPFVFFYEIIDFLFLKFVLTFYDNKKVDIKNYILFNFST